MAAGTITRGGFVRGRLATAASLRVVTLRFRQRWLPVRIVARGTQQTAGTSQEALRFHQPIRRSVNRDAILRRRLRKLEVDHEIAQRLARPVGERRAIKPSNGVR